MLCKNEYRENPHHRYPTGGRPGHDSPSMVDARLLGEAILGDRCIARQEARG
jgi:hypothetical protein